MENKRVALRGEKSYNNFFHFYIFNGTFTYFIDTFLIDIYIFYIFVTIVNASTFKKKNAVVNLVHNIATTTTILSLHSICSESKK